MFSFPHQGLPQGAFPLQKQLPYAGVYCSLPQSPLAVAFAVAHGVTLFHVMNEANLHVMVGDMDWGCLVGRRVINRKNL